MKRYGALFTCLASRAVHIEVADSFETDSFINAMTRFICRRGSVMEIRCGIGTNFIGVEAELKKVFEEMDDQEIKTELLKENIDWIKNPACVSNFGGVWERQIRSITSVMNGLIREHGSRLDEESLRTFPCEAEYTINNRPLTLETFNDPLSAPPLSPSMLLTGKTRLVLPPPGEYLLLSFLLRCSVKTCSSVPVLVPLLCRRPKGPSWTFPGLEGVLKVSK